MGLELLKTLFFKVMFLSGYLKIASGCPAWQDLTAVKIHLQSMPIPHIGSWYAHFYLSDHMKQLAAQMTIYSEGLLPIMMYLPMDYFVRSAYLIQSLLMVAVMATGNFNFFNILVISIGLASLDDHALHRILPHKLVRAFAGGESIAAGETFAYEQPPVAGSAAPAPAAPRWRFFGLAHPSAGVVALFWGLQYFLFADYRYCLQLAVDHMDWLFLLMAISAVASMLRAHLCCGRMGLARRYFRLCLAAFLACALFTPNLVSFTDSIQGQGIGRASQKLARSVREFSHDMRHLMIGSSYGLFRVMTGNHGTPVLVLEATLELVSGTGQQSLVRGEIEVEGKLGDLAAMPGVYIPCQKRLAWQLWFSALEKDPVGKPHFLALLYKLLKHREGFGGEVWVSLGAESEAGPRTRLPLTPEVRIRQIRVSRYLYSYATSTAARPAAYWQRRLDPSFAPVEVSVEDLKAMEGLLSATGLKAVVENAGQRPVDIARLFDWISFC